MDNEMIKFDWRSKKINGVRILPHRVRDQGNTDTCMQHALINVCEMRLRRKEAEKPKRDKKLVQLSVRQLIDRTKRHRFDIHYGMIALYKEGVSAWGFGKKKKEPYYTFRIKGLRQLGVKRSDGSRNYDQVKQYIREEGGVFAAIHICNHYEEWNDPESPYAPQGPKIGYHAVVLIGYDDEKGGWIYLNSYGVKFGYRGFACVRYYCIEQYHVPIFMEDKLRPDDEQPGSSLGDSGVDGDEELRSSSRDSSAGGDEEAGSSSRDSDAGGDEEPGSSSGDSGAGGAEEPRSSSGYSARDPMYGRVYERRNKQNQQ